MTVGTDGNKRPHILMLPLPFMGHTPIFVHLIHQLSLKYAGEATVTMISAVEVTAEFSTLHEKGVFGNLDMRFITMFTPITDCFTDDPKLPLYLAKVCNKWKREFEPFKQNIFEKRRLHLDTEIGSPTCIIADCFLHFAKEFGDGLGIRWIPVYTLPMWLGLCFIYAPDINIHPRHSPQPIDLPGLEMFRVSDPPYEVWAEKEFLREHRKYVEESAGILVNTPEYLELLVGAITEFRAHLERNCPTGKVPTIYTVGPRSEISGFGSEYRSKLSSIKLPDQQCLEWLDKQPAKSVLYIAFGTLANLKPAEVMQVAIGLEASGAKYLWNLKVPATSSLSECLPAGFLERTERHGFLLTGWAPQVKILAHPALGGFMTHCGWNSTSESICSGVPMIAAPVFADQCLNARVITERWNVGVPLTHGYKHAGYEIHSTEVENSIKTLMFEETGREVRKNAEEERKRLVSLMIEGGTTYDMTQSFLKLITTV